MKKEDIALALMRKQLVKSGLSPELVDQCLSAAKAMAAPSSPPLVGEDHTVDVKREPG